MIIKKERLGLAEGVPVTGYRVKNREGAQLWLMDYGATVTGLLMPNRRGELINVVLGYDTLAEYIENDGYFGAAVGRYCNRIAGAAFTLDDAAHRLTANDGANTLHGGRGWSRRVFTARPFEEGVEFRLSDNEGSDGFPGALEAAVRYTLRDDNALQIDYTAVSLSPTVVSLTNHSYFNLAGAGEILDHELSINAQFYTPVDSALIPTGEVIPVDGTPFDFRNRRRIMRGYYDHNFALSGDMSAPAAVLCDSAGGMVMEVYTDMPGIQLYCSGMLTSRRGRGGARYERYSGVCLETQFYPNSPNVPQFPSPILRPGEEYKKTTVYKFKTE